jgi:CheY-like chemotaxis protein
MGDGGTLTITARNIHVPPDDCLVEISVADSGTGIPKHLLTRIFEPYFTTRTQGSGLGLATCYSIIKKHDGTITVESIPAMGTTVHISLPAAQRPEQSDPATPPVLQRGEVRILVMDDEETVREVLTAMLEGLGYLVECTADGSAAVELYGQRLADGLPFDAVIMDLTIPGGVGGKEAIAALLQIDPQVKAVVSSGYSNDAIMANYRDYGFSAVLCKPYLPREMSTVLHELLAPRLTAQHLDHDTSVTQTQQTA